MYLERLAGAAAGVWRRFLCCDPMAGLTLRRWIGHDKQDCFQEIETLERILIENILPFWYPEAIDRECGGYRLNHDLMGRWKGRAERHIVSQSRMVWFFSRMTNSRFARGEYLEASRHGYEFLHDRMWDRQFGGFYWEVGPSGTGATKPHKHLYGQAFGLYAMSEYATASGDASAATLATELFDILESRCRDRKHGGYIDFFSRDWKQFHDSSKAYLNGDPSVKLMNTHIHLLEAVTSYFVLTGDGLAKERLIELIFIQSNAVVRKSVGVCTDRYQLDWTPLRGARHERVCYGHDLENVWLLIKACDAAGISNGPLLDLYRTLFASALRYGFDRRKGGFYHSGPFNMPADRREKVWWIQAESLISALRMYCLTREEIYYNCFSQTLDWIVKSQADWEYGDWHAIIDANGKPRGDKAGAMWKSAYHNGRAVTECLEMLSLLLESSVPKDREGSDRGTR